MRERSCEAVESNPSYTVYVCVCYLLSPSCRCTGGFSAGAGLRLAVLQTALPSTSGPRLPQTSASQRDCSRGTGAQTGQLQLHPAPVEQLKMDRTLYWCHLFWVTW